MSDYVMCVIPARYGSTRLPGKPLCEINGVPLIVWVYNCAFRSGAFDSVIVATDDEKILNIVEKNGGNAVMTSADHSRGIDRVYEVILKKNCTHVVNLQGDEPGIPAQILRDLVSELKKIDNNTLLTIASHATIKEKDCPHTVKVVLNRVGEALYFSRSPIPYDLTKEGCFLKHKGIYGFTAGGLEKFCSFPQGELEKRENLEQLRALENGMKIKCLIKNFDSVGIDTPEDLRKFRKQVEAGYEF
ncbi:MAG TPA: 3-deoxy-manno-octulosonate cytidylyltransferase [Chitinispirillaceae bacterium]|nr:3-deoxy-manno-octulosonate cytidylyltransferase [Chitinispirillaceae bacterium]